MDGASRQTRPTAARGSGFERDPKRRGQVSDTPRPTVGAQPGPTAHELAYHRVGTERETVPHEAPVLGRGERLPPGIPEGVEARTPPRPQVALETGNNVRGCLDGVAEHRPVDLLADRQDRRSGCETLCREVETVLKQLGTGHFQTPEKPYCR